MKNNVLKMLEESRGKNVSGGRLAEELGVTRAAVNKAVQALRSSGYQIEATSGRGYCLSENCDKLSEFGIRRFLNENKDRKILICEETASTNALAKELLKEEKSSTLVLAEKQSAGRGRLGRSFYSPQGSGLYMSISLKPDISAEKSVFITVAAAVAVSRAIDTLFGIDTQIKWVNDIYYKERKVCGILTEASFEMESGRISQAVVGIGVNVRAPKGGFPEDIAEKAGAICDDSGNVTRNRLAAEIVNRFDELYPHLEELEFLDEYRQKSCLIGKHVVVIPAHAEQYMATVLGIDESARLVICTNDGKEVHLASGDVSIAQSG